MTTKNIRTTVREAEREDLHAALNYAWGWFSLHSSQRMQLMNYLVVSLALTISAYAGAFTKGNFQVACGIALVGILLALVFERLDMRTRELVHVSEASLTELEQEIGRRAGLSDLQFVRSVDSPGRRLTSYRVVLRALTRTSLVLFAAALVFAAYKAWHLSH